MSARCCATLESNPRVAANTIVVFTSDHGEYGASHGLRGKGGGAYEEAIRVPLIVKDPRRKLTSAIRPAAHAADLERGRGAAVAAASPAAQMRGAQSRATRTSPGRADLTAILANPRARGRHYVLHATDEIVTEFATEPYAADAPLHVVAMRTANAKFATYSNWGPEGIEPEAGGTGARALRLPHARRAPGAAQRRRQQPPGRAAEQAVSSTRCARSCAARCRAS